MPTDRWSALDPTDDSDDIDFKSAGEEDISSTHADDNLVGPTALDFSDANAPVDHAVGAREPLQVGSRVSFAARVFDSRRGARWSVQTFGPGGCDERVYGVVNQLGGNAGGRGRTYTVKWDI
eukprot:SAG11_NODE_12403_length_705_cov_1.419142_1_plen_122_part_00